MDRLHTTLSNNCADATVSKEHISSAAGLSITTHESFQMPRPFEGTHRVQRKGHPPPINREDSSAPCEPRDTTSFPFPSFRLPRTRLLSFSPSALLCITISLLHQNTPQVQIPSQKNVQRSHRTARFQGALDLVLMEEGPATVLLIHLCFSSKETNMRTSLLMAV